MTRAVFLGLILVVVAIYSRETRAQDGTCWGDHEVWNDCGTACPLTCRMPELPAACVLGCRRGCECEIGYLRRDDGVCVLQEDC